MVDGHSHAAVRPPRARTGRVIVVASLLSRRRAGVRRRAFSARCARVLVFGSRDVLRRSHRWRDRATRASSVCFALAHRLAFFDRGSGWLIDRSHSHRRFVMSGLAVSSCAVLVALAVGPSLPGANDEALVAWRDIGNGWAQSDDSVTLAPLVSVRAQLIDQSDTEVFVVQSSQPDYWRLTSLDSFDGTEWTASSSTSAALTLPTEPTSTALRQVGTTRRCGHWRPRLLRRSRMASTTPLPSIPIRHLVRRIGSQKTANVWSSAIEAEVSVELASYLCRARAPR